MTASTPSRFQGQRLENPPKHLIKFKRLFGFEVALDDPAIERIRAGLMQSDPIADEVVDWASMQPPGAARALFERALTEGVDRVPDAPEALRTWMEKAHEVPAWVDREKLRTACRTSRRVGHAGATVLGAMSLMGGYRSSAAVKPLAMTGALDRMVVRRLAETSRFVQDVYASEDMGPTSEGFRAAARVRLMHALVRRSLARRPTWRTEAWGLPINQADMAATHLEFSAIYLVGLRLLGFRFTKYELDAHMHLWRYVSNLMGLDDALLAHDFEEGLRHMYIHACTQPYADEDSRALAKALYEFPRMIAKTPLDRVMAEVMTRYNTGVSRITLGDDAVDDIGLPPARWAPLLFGLSAIVFAAETARMHIPGATELAERVGRRAQ
ncbi:MAG: DUF2236 domain-containing protein, partial [Polyangiaceae bacterium]|nr:DUF2236 domain-containing protein [Polyangiaceae bacterium]